VTRGVAAATSAWYSGVGMWDGHHVGQVVSFENSGFIQDKYQYQREWFI